MTYEEALDNVYGRLVFGIKPGLERIAALLDRLGNPQKQLKFVHVAGTNGKGTCSTLTASALQEWGCTPPPMCWNFGSGSRLTER